MGNRIEKEEVPGTITIERTHLTPTDEVVSLFCRGYNGRPPWYEIYSMSQAKKEIEKYMRIDENSQLYLLRIDGGLAGFAVVSNSLIPDDNAKYIQEVVVDPLVQQTPYRIGTRIMERIIADAKDENISQISLQTDIRNTSAISLYRKMGFISKRTQQVGQATARNFILKLDTPSGEDGLQEIFSLPLLSQEQLFANQRELQRLLFWKWLCTIQRTSTPQVPDDWQKYQATLQPFIAKALENWFLNRCSYFPDTNQLIMSASNYGYPLIWGDKESLARLELLSGFLLSLQSFSPSKIPSKDMERIIDACFASSRRIGKQERTNFVGFVCASYENDFAGVSLSAQTSRLRFLGERIKILEQYLLALGANIKLTFLFADTDYEIYPIDSSAENIDNFTTQYTELRNYCKEQFNPGTIRLIPWSRYRGRYQKIYQEALSKAQPIAQRRTSKIPNLSVNKQVMRTRQQADYAAQAAILPRENTILLVLEDRGYNGDYDILFSQGETLPKVTMLDINEYTTWAKNEVI